MPPELTLVVDGLTSADVGATLRSVDESTLASRRFELLLLVDDPSDASWRRFAERRPNVRLLPPEADRSEAAEGERLLHLVAGQVLFPEALVRLLDFAAAHDLDLLLGRQVTPSGALDAAVLQDVVDADLAPDELLAGPVLRRRGLGDLDARRSDGADLRVGALASYPVLLEPGTEPAGPTTEVTTEEPELAWEGPALRVRLRGRLTATDAEGWRPVVTVRQLPTGISYLLPGAGQDAPTGTTGEWEVEAVLDLRSAAAGKVLPAGEWQVEVTLVKQGHSSAAVAVPGAALPVAFVDDRVVLCSRPSLVLDVGPTTQACSQLPTAEGASVTESAAGCRLDLVLPGWHVLADRPLPVGIALDRLRLPAQVVPAAGSVTLTALVSGLPGRYPLSLKLGRAPLQRTGLLVVIGGDGAVSVTTAPPKAEPVKRAAAAKPAPPKPSPRPRTAPVKPRPVPATGPVAQLRRAVPRAWEPQVRRLAKVPLLRSAYRRLTGLGRS